LGKGRITRQWIEARVKIAVVAYSAPPYSSGGVAAAHFNLFRLLRQAGHDARLFTFGDQVKEASEVIFRNGSPAWLTKVIRFINRIVFGLLQPGRSAYQTFDILSSAIGAREMDAQIQKFSPDAIVLSDHGAPGLWLEKGKARVILVSHHNPKRFEASIGGLTNGSNLDIRLAISLEQRMLSKVDAVVCPSHYMLDWFAKTYKFSHPLVVIPNILDEKFLDSIAPSNLHKALQIEEDRPIVYLPSVGEPLKGERYAKEIVRTVAALIGGEIGFYMPGTKPEALTSQTTPGNARLYMPGPVPYEQHIANLKNCLFGISPSLMENYSMALLEAVHCGVPMLVFKTGGNADIIHEGKNGHLVGPGDVAGIGVFAAKWLQSEDMQGLKRETKEYTQKNLSAQAALISWEKILEQG
jgi:glycosyltransferase involved in cell wall biosynthesis